MIPQLGKSPLCPDKSLLEMHKACPANVNDPLFCIQGIPVTQVQAHLKKILNMF